MSNDEAVNSIDKIITGNEVLLVLKYFSHDKCLGADGWPAEFFIFFFDIMGTELTEIVEQFQA